MSCRSPRSPKFLIYITTYNNSKARIVTKTVEESPPKNSALLSKIERYKITVDFSQKLKNRSVTIQKRLISRLFRSYLSLIDPLRFGSMKDLTENTLTVFKRCNYLTTCNWERAMFDAIVSSKESKNTDVSGLNEYFPPEICSIVLDYLTNKRRKLNNTIHFYALLNKCENQVKNKQHQKILKLVNTASGRYNYRRSMHYSKLSSRYSDPEDILLPRY